MKSRKAYVFFMAELRKYQADDLDAVREKIRAGERRIMFEASVGYGKSLIIETIAQGYAGAGKNVLVLSNRKAVVDQLDKRRHGSDRILVSTVQGISRSLEKIPAPSAILVDEFHMGGSGAQYGRVFDAFPEALVIGFTGTPRPESFDILPTHVIGRGARWLTENGFLAPLLYYCPETIDFSRIKTRGGDFDEEEIIAAVERSEICGDAIGSYRDHCLGQPTLAFTINKKHAKSVADEFLAAGYESEILTGDDSDEEVERKIRYLADGGLVISIDKVSAGFDLPALSNIISLRPTKSEQLWVQQLGRAARLADGKAHGHIFDHAGNTFRCGTLTEERDWKDLERGADERQTETGERLSIRRCSECLFVFETGCTCPICGHDNVKDLRISKRTAIAIRLHQAEEIEAAREAKKRAERRAQGQARDFKSLASEIARRPGTKNRHSARHSAKHVLISRMQKAIDGGDIDTAKAIYSDLAANGFRVDFPTDEAA